MRGRVVKPLTEASFRRKVVAYLKHKDWRHLPLTGIPNCPDLLVIPTMGIPFFIELKRSKKGYCETPLQKACREDFISRGQNSIVLYGDDPLWQTKINDQFKPIS